MNVLRITARAEKRLKTGHLWLYSNEVDNQQTPLKSIQTGEQVAIENSAGKILAYAFINPSQLICGKIVSRKKPFDRKHLKKTLDNAIAWRESVYQKPFYRLVYAEGDYLPGLIVDRFDDICVVQINSAGMEYFRDDIADLLQIRLGCKGVLFRNDGNSRKLEGLAISEPDSYGEVPEYVSLEENDTKFLAPVYQGQKTGWFYDHRNNRAKLATMAKGKRVLDVFSYVGAWGIQCLTHGASHLTAIDASELALDCLEENASLNGFANTATCFQGNAFDAMQTLAEQGEKFDIVVLDPPAFIKKKKDLNQGLQAYRRSSELALRLLDKEGLLVSASCSMHLSHEALQETVQKASRHIDRNLSLVYKGGHAEDHPVHPAIAETEYLKAQFYKNR